MKQVLAPTCPRCNSSGDVKKTAKGRVSAHRRADAGTHGYVLGGHSIRPENPEWYCAVCEQSFGAWREFWGRPVTNLIQ